MKKYILAIVSVATLSINHAQVLETLPPSYRDADKELIFRAEAEKKNSLVHTKLDLKFDFEKEYVLGEAWITLKPHFYSTDELILDAKAMLIHEVALVKGSSKKTLKHEYDDLQLKIKLDKTYTKNEEYTIYIKYTARPNEVKEEGSAAISDAKGLYFINPRGEEPDKPTQIWTQGETESSSCWFPTIDKPNQKTSQEIYLTVPDKFVTLSNGLLKKQTKNSNGTRTDYWNFDKKHAPYLFFVGVGDYAVVKDKWKNIEVDYYVEHEYAPYAKDIFGDTPAMLQFFSELLDYEYPWQKFSQIVARDYVSGAMENTTAVLFLEQVQQKPGQLIDGNLAESIIAHELFHHWFGDLVTAESWGNLTVNESFANYSEYLWFEHKYGKEKAEEDRFNDLLGYKSGGNFNKNLVRYHYASREDMFDGVSYNKGGKGILHMLRYYLGDEAFFKGLNKYLHDYKYGTAEAVQIRLALEEVSGRDLNWFFDQWYFGSGHPQLNMAYDYNSSNKKIKVTIVQSQEPLFEFPFTIDVVVDGKAQRHELWVAKQKENSFEFAANKNPEVVIPNADQVLLCDINDNKSIEEFISQYKNSTEYASRRLALDAIVQAQSTNDKALEALLKAAAEDKYEGLRSYAIYQLDMQDAKVKSKAIPVLKKIASSDSKTTVQATALQGLVMAEVKEEAVYEKALSSPSYSVQAAGVSGLYKTNKDKALQLVSNLDEEVIEGSAELVAELIPTWIEKNDKSKLGLVAQQAAFYEFVKFQDSELGNKLEKGFVWVMSSDDINSTNKVAKQYKQVYGYYKENVGLIGIIKSMTQRAIELKSSAYKNNPTESLEKQVNVLQELMNSYK